MKKKKFLTPKQIKRENKKRIKSLSEKQGAKIGKSFVAFLVFSYD